MKKYKLLFVYDYFYPGFKAGGPVQSLTNLVITFQKDYNILVITSIYDLQSTDPYPDIIFNNWNNITLPGCMLPIKVWYAHKKLNSAIYKKIIDNNKPDVIYLNGMFSYSFFITPLIALYQLKVKPKVVICPRGMLQHGALEGKSLKKKLYIAALKGSGLLKGVQWHATNQEEMKDIRRAFGWAQIGVIASNIPKAPVSVLNFPAKETGKINLVYLSLIAEKKNLLFVLEIMQYCTNVRLDIYGPVKDNLYWGKCKKLMAQMPKKVAYKGGISPAKVQEIFSEYDASILLTKGENFGHALYESLSSGRPIITSNFTPWLNLQQQKAGWNITIGTITEGVKLLDDLCMMPVDLFNDYCIGAYNLAERYYKELNSIEEYRELFNPDN